MAGAAIANNLTELGWHERARPRFECARDRAWITLAPKGVCGYGVGNQPPPLAGHSPHSSMAVDDGDDAISVAMSDRCVP
jgi:hypothetical protein